MLGHVLLRLVLTAVAFAVTAWLLSGMDLSGGVLGYLWVSVLFGLVNAIVGTLVRALTFPLTLFTLGLFSIFVNALLLDLTDALTSNLTIDQFWWTAIWASIILSCVSVTLEVVVNMFAARRAGQVRPAFPA